MVLAFDAIDTTRICVDAQLQICPLGNGFRSCSCLRFHALILRRLFTAIQAILCPRVARFVLRAANFANNRVFLAQRSQRRPWFFVHEIIIHAYVRI